MKNIKTYTLMLEEQSSLDVKLRMEVMKLLINSGANPFTVFKDVDEFMSYFNRDLSWMKTVPESVPEPMKSKLKRMIRGKSAFGM